MRVACACDAAAGRAPATGACASASPRMRRRQAAVDELRRAAGTELDARVIAALARALLERRAA